MNQIKKYYTVKDAPPCNLCGDRPVNMYSASESRECRTTHCRLFCLHFNKIDWDKLMGLDSEIKEILETVGRRYSNVREHVDLAHKILEKYK